MFLYRYWNGKEITRFANDFGVSKLIIAGAIVALVAIAPWNDLRLRLKKVGFLEFDRVVNQQAREHIQEFAELRARIEELETRVRRGDTVGPIADHLAQVDLAPLLSQFLKEHRPNAFSPLKIHQWGSRQKGYEKLGTYTQGAIRTVLQSLVASGQVATRVSRMGNTLYSIASSWSQAYLAP